MSGEIRDFKDLQVWQLAMDLAESAYQLAVVLPRSERFELAAQNTQGGCLDSLQHRGRVTALRNKLS